MKALILAAGKGSRLGKITKEQPKCHVKVHGISLLQWQLNSLKHAQIDAVGIVTGYQSNKITGDFTKFHNSNWRNTNMVSSLMKAKKWLENDTCLISYSDIIYSPQLVDDLINCSGDIVISYDENWKDLWNLRFDNPLDDAETFLQKKGKLLTIGAKTQNISDIQGQYMGLLKVTQKGWKSIMEILDNQQKNIKNLDMTALLAILLKHNITINTVPNTLPWFEVDNSKDLQIYNSIEFKKFINYLID